MLENPDFRPTDPVVGDLPTVVLEKWEVAPLRFVLGRVPDVWGGPFSEVVCAPIMEGDNADAQR